jgi:hypothetical protein
VTATVTPGAVAGLFEYYAVLPAVVLAPDTRFWISIAVDEDTRWFWAGSAAASQCAFWHPSANDWAGGLPFAFDFALTNDVVGTTIPEPSASLLLGVGIVAAAGAMRVRKK